MSDAPRRSFWLVLAAFTLIGPYVGGLVVWCMLAIDSFGGLAGPLSIKDVLGFPFAGLIGYPFGIIPAAVTGLVAVALSGPIRSRPTWIALVTASGGVISGAILGWSHLFILPGVAAAFVSGSMVLWIRARREASRAR